MHMESQLDQTAPLLMPIWLLQSLLRYRTLIPTFSCLAQRFIKGTNKTSESNLFLNPMPYTIPHTLYRFQVSTYRKTTGLRLNRSQPDRGE